MHVKVCMTNQKRLVMRAEMTPTKPVVSRACHQKVAADVVVVEQVIVSARR